MLPKRLRVPIQNFPKNAKAIFSDANITIKAAKSGLLYDRLGIMVNKQVSKSSFQRNFLRRKFLNLLSEKQTRKNSGRDLLIILKPPIIKLTKKELTDRLKIYERLV